MVANSSVAVVAAVSPTDAMPAESRAKMTAIRAVAVAYPGSGIPDGRSGSVCGCELRTEERMGATTTTSGRPPAGTDGWTGFDTRSDAHRM